MMRLRDEPALFLHGRDGWYRSLRCFAMGGFMSQIPFGTRLPRGFRTNPPQPEPKPKSIIPDGVTKLLQQRKREFMEKPGVFRLAPAGPCPKCGKEFKKLRTHYRKCKE